MTESQLPQYPFNWLAIRITVADSSYASGPMPLRFTIEESTVVFALATPIAQHERPAFYEAVAEALTHSGERGPGAAHRIAREKQAVFVADLRVEAALTLGRQARHLQPLKRQA
jgi:hypothetical protein